jgi:hypothetical protein
VFFKSRGPYVAAPTLPPPAAAKVSTTAQAPADPGLVLGGVAILERARKAYIFSKAGERGAWLGEGEVVQGWRVESIGPGAATLQQAGRVLQLELHPQRR